MFVLLIIRFCYGIKYICYVWICSCSFQINNIVLVWALNLKEDYVLHLNVLEYSYIAIWKHKMTTRENKEIYFF